MHKVILAVGLSVVIGAWWIAAAPREEIGCCMADSIDFDPATVRATDAVDRSAQFAADLKVFPSDLPAYDDAVFLDGGATALVTAHDGKIWMVDLAANAAETIADVPLMAWGIHEAPGDETRVYFCSSGSYEDRPAGEVSGLYRLDLGTRPLRAMESEAKARSPRKA